LSIADNVLLILSAAAICVYITLGLQWDLLMLLDGHLLHISLIRIWLNIRTSIQNITLLW
jgi:hypothetical protein